LRPTGTLIQRAQASDAPLRQYGCLSGRPCEWQSRTEPRHGSGRDGVLPCVAPTMRFGSERHPRVSRFAMACWMSRSSGLPGRLTFLVVAWRSTSRE